MLLRRYRRVQSTPLLERIAEAPARIIIVAGPRQVGKSTLVQDTLPDCGRAWTLFPVEGEDAGNVATEGHAAVAPKLGRPPDAEWLVERWTAARERARESTTGFVLVFDEIQRISRWSEIVKDLWDADRAVGVNMHVVLLGSSPLLMWQGLTESLAGRFELLRLTHWSYVEMYEAFGYSLDDYMFFGGYPGSAQLMSRLETETDWRRYVRDSLIMPSIERDILAMTRIDKPALLKQAFELGCAYSGQILSYNKMLGHLRDAGNTTTLANYMDVLEKAGLLVGLQKYSGTEHRQRGSSPKLVVLNACLSSVHSGYTKAEALADRTYWGRQVESVVGAHLYNSGAPDIKLYYWRDSPYEVDYVIERGPKLAAVEVKSGVASGSASGLVAFQHRYKHAKRLVVGGEGIPLTEFLSHPAEYWLGQGS
jgi:predicted AAA+ superfamily ATPase